MSEQYLNEPNTQYKGTLFEKNYEDELAESLMQQNIATAKKYNIPLWLLTSRAEPHMRECPEELDVEEDKA